MPKLFVPFESVGPQRVLLYGGPGAGKTDLGVSSFFDIDEEKLIRDGRLLYIGGEFNPSYKIPEANVRRFVSPVNDPHSFVDTFVSYLRKVAVDARKGQKLGAIVIDGFTEFNVLFQHTFGGDPDKDKFKKWDGLKDKIIEALNLLDPIELGCHVIATARVGERRKGVKSKEGDVTGADPTYMDFKYFPEMDGWARKNLPHYFNFVLYVDQDTGTVNNKPNMPTHVLYTLGGGGDYWVKNQYERQWIKRNLPSKLVNASFDDFLALVGKATAPIDKPAEK